MTGEIIYLGTVLADSSYADASIDKDNIKDGDYTTGWASANSGSGWIGYDLGAAVAPTEVRFAPTPGVAGASPNFDFEIRMFGSYVQSSSAADFSANLATYGT